MATSVRDSASLAAPPITITPASPGISTEFPQNAGPQQDGLGLGGEKRSSSFDEKDRDVLVRFDLIVEEFQRLEVGYVGVGLLARVFFPSRGVRKEVERVLMCLGW